MAVIRKHNLYRLATLAWGLVVFAVIVLTLSGNARPFLTPDALPIDGPFQMVGVAVVLVVAGALVIDRLERRAWTAAGERAGLSPRGGGLRSRPDLVGTVDGREVRARTVKRKTGGDGESGSSTTTFTVVETALAEPTDRGFIVTAGGAPTAGTEDLPVDLADRLTTVGDVAVLGEPGEFAREALTPRAQNAIAAADSLEGVHVGESADVFLEAIEASGGGLAGSMVGLMETKIKERMPSDAGSVATERKGVVLDAEDLAARAEAVAAVADGVEAALAAESDR